MTTIRREGIMFLAGLTAVVAAWHSCDFVSPPEWLRHQRAYEGLLAPGAQAMSFGIRTMQVEGVGEERCLTCHLGILHEPAERAPFRAHPDTGCRLPVLAQGCTGCHGGEPAALEAARAHGRAAVSRRPLLDDGDASTRARRLQAGCAGCHLRRDGGVLRYEADVVPEVSAGLRVYLSSGCAACHRLPGVFASSDAAPNLDGIGLRMGRPQLRDMIMHPQQLRPSSPMPPSPVGGDELERMLTFLQAQVGLDEERGCGAACVAASRGASPTLASHFDDALPERSNAASGALWARRAGCQGCHRLSGSEGGVPDLSRISRVRDERHLRLVLSNPREWCPETLMPPVQLPEVVIESMVAWLAAQMRPLPSSPAEVFGDVCARCHGAQPDPRVVVLSRKPPRLDGRAERIPRELFVKVATEGVERTAMAPWGRVLTPDFLGAIHDTLP